VNTDQKIEREKEKMRKDYIYNMVVDGKERTRSKEWRRYNDMRHSKRKYEIAMNNSHGYFRDAVADEYDGKMNKLSKATFSNGPKSVHKTYYRSFNEEKCEEAWKTDLNLGLLEFYDDEVLYA
jgi:hypothetical protein